MIQYLISMFNVQSIIYFRDTLIFTIKAKAYFVGQTEPK